MMDLEELPQEIQEAIADYLLNIIEVRRFPYYEKFQTGISVEVALQKIMEECSLSEDKAQEYIQKYWR